MSPSPSQNKPGSLTVVGIGPGSPEMLTRAAELAISQADIVIGNDFYIDQIPDLLKEQEVIKSRMGKEVDRAKQAISLAQEKHVVMISGGDPGVYGMAGLILEMAEQTSPDLTVEVIPGVTAASAGAALLGAPLTNDFAVISLSDLLTPREIIEKRIRAICTAGIPMVLYNPKSRTRTSLFEDAIAIARKHLSDDTPVGIVKDAYRPDQTIIVTTLREVMDVEDSVDMHTVVFIGGEETRMLRRHNNARGMFTPRGYHRKYEY
ncbi:MAG: precorrin-3B C(17)-methyltransferase [Methanomicrobiales archaeon]|nr:precorrin-3B C(17)-methyltransferase [Methanomicrobiales archaeon]